MNQTTSNIQTCDIAFIVALREEFNEIDFLVEPEGKRFKNVHDLEIYFHSTFPGFQSGLSIYSLLIDDQGPEAAAIATSQFLNIVRPKLLVNIGISGRICNDCRLGDVILASRCDNSLYRAKAKIDGIRPGGREYKLDALSRPLYTAITEQQPYYSYANLSNSNLAILRSSELIGDVPKTHHGPICSTPYVVDDPRFVTWLKDSRNRTLLATDMESAAIAQAADSYGLHDGKILIVRGISDPADGNKSALDSVEDGLLRKVAMRNACALVKHSVLNLLSFANDDCRVIGSQEGQKNVSLGYKQIRNNLDQFSKRIQDGEDEAIACKHMDSEANSSKGHKQQFKDVAHSIYQFEIQRENNKITSDIGKLDEIQRDYLIAVWVMNCLVDGNLNKDEDGYETLSHVYPQRVNRFCKAILQNIPDEKKLVDILINAFERKGKEKNRQSQQNSERVKAHVCYLLGRIKTHQQKRRAIESLEGWRDGLGQIAKKNRISEKGTYPVQRVFSTLNGNGERLLLRTICISLVLLGKQDEAESYVKACIRHKAFDQLNRGFHLEYYGDIEYDPRESMNNLDNLGECKETFQKLHDKLTVSYSSKNPYALRDIELQTLLSIVQQRFSVGQLSEEFRNKTLALLTSYSSTQLTSILILKSYCDLLREHLSEPVFNRASLIRKLYSLKKLPRSGWNSAEEGRTTPHPETVLSHTAGGMLLIHFCLPENLSISDKLVLGETYCAGYSKNEISKMFLVHDLAEAFTGDLLPTQRDDPAKEREDRINSVIDLYGTYPDIEQFGLYTLCSSFDKGSTINARIAREIDLLDNLAQLIIERDNEGVTIPDYDIWVEYIVSRVTTPVGKRIIQLFMK